MKAAIVLRPQGSHRNAGLGDFRLTKLPDGSSRHAYLGYLYDLTKTDDVAKYNADFNTCAGHRRVDTLEPPRALIFGVAAESAPAQPPAFDLTTAKEPATLDEALTLIPHLMQADEQASLIAITRQRLAASQKAIESIPQAPVPTTTPTTDELLASTAPIPEGDAEPEEVEQPADSAGGAPDSLDESPTPPDSGELTIPDPAPASPKPAAKKAAKKAARKVAKKTEAPAGQ